MTRNRYIVVLHDGEWKIEHKGELSARYRTQEEALLDALNAARRLDREGQDAEVLTQGTDFGLRTEWTNRLGNVYEHESAKGSERGIGGGRTKRSGAKGGGAGGKTLAKFVMLDSGVGGCSER